MVHMKFDKRKERKHGMQLAVRALGDDLLNVADGGVVATARSRCSRFVSLVELNLICISLMRVMLCWRPRARY